VVVRRSARRLASQGLQLGQGALVFDPVLEPCECQELAGRDPLVWIVETSSQSTRIRLEELLEPRNVVLIGTRLVGPFARSRPFTRPPSRCKLVLADDAVDSALETLVAEDAPRSVATARTLTDQPQHFLALHACCDSSTSRVGHTDNNGSKRIREPVQFAVPRVGLAGVWPDSCKKMRA
jgi:hypothetical protein